MYLDEKSNCSTKWWLSAVCCVLTIPAIFVSICILFGFGQDQLHSLPPAPVSMNKAFVEVVNIEEKTDKNPGTEEVEEYKVSSINTKPLGLSRETLEEMISERDIRKSASIKKSEAIYPQWTDPDENKEPVVLDPVNDFRPDFNLPNFPPKDTQPNKEYDEYEDEEEEEDENNIFSILKDNFSNVLGLVGGQRSLSNDWMDLVSVVNETLGNRNITAVLSNLKDTYGDPNKVSAQSENFLNNTTSLVAFGLLAIDLFLLHNVQQIAWNEENAKAEKMLDDPEVVAMNSLFLPVDRIKDLQKNQYRHLDEPQRKTAFQEFLDFISGALTALMNLSKAYKGSMLRNGVEPRDKGPTPLDCIWTIYCRNLEKTTKLGGPYGFLSKMNSFGLRLMMGEFPVEKAVEKLITEATTGWSSLDCRKLFPKCSAEEAQKVVLATAMGENSVVQR